MTLIDSARTGKMPQLCTRWSSKRR